MGLNDIIIYPSACVDPDNKIGGWAAGVKYSKGRFIACGTFKKECSGDIAELMAVANALFVVGKDLDTEDGTLIIRTSNTNVIAAIKGERRIKGSKDICKKIKAFIPAGCSFRITKPKRTEKWWFKNRVAEVANEEMLTRKNKINKD